MKKLIMFVLLFPAFAFANIQTHNVYVHKAGIDTSMYKLNTPDFNGAAQQGAQEGFALGQAIKARRQAKKNEQRTADYSLDLINSTNGLKVINKENIIPLIQKYPERSAELLEMLRNSN